LARILRGDILWADLDPVQGREQAGFRPVLVITHDLFNQRSGTIIGLAITSKNQKVGFPLTLELPSATLPRQSWVKISQVRTLDVSRMGKRLGRVPPEFMQRVIEGLNELIAD